jgi:hypothetical protein
VHFVTKVSLYFWNLRKMLCFFTPILSRLFIKNVHPYIVYCTVWPRPTMKQLLSQTNFYVISPSFLRFTTTFRGTGTHATVPISTHPTVHTVHNSVLAITFICLITFILPSFITFIFLLYNLYLCGQKLDVSDNLICLVFDLYLPHL